MSNDFPETENDKESKTNVNTINEINDNNVKKSDKFDFEPLLYSFKISPFSHSSSTTLMTISDDRLHQDHAFGIIWLLFSEQKKSPSIFQLHWCLKFLQKLKNNDGTYSEDVNKCIQKIQDDLITKYAKLGISLKHINESITIDENAMITSTPKPRRVQRSLDTDMEISFTYDEMISKGPTPCMEEVNYNYDVLINSYTSSDSIKRFIEEMQISKESIANMSIKELLQFFDDIRKEYLETIKREVDKIYNIENFVQTIDENSFKAYITDDLIKYLNKLGDSNTEDSTEKL